MTEQLNQTEAADGQSRLTGVLAMAVELMQEAADTLENIPDYLLVKLQIRHPLSDELRGTILMLNDAMANMELRGATDELKQ